MKKCLLLLVVALAAVSCSSEKVVKMSKKKKSISIMQGTTTDSKTIINFVYPKNKAYELNIYSPTGVLPNAITEVQEEQKSFSPWKLVNAYIEGLKPNIEYRIEIESKGKKDSWFFSTIDSKKKNHKIVIASCMSDQYAEVSALIWPSVMAQNADALMLIGDNVYVDVYNHRYVNWPANKDRFWERYIDARFSIDLYSQKKLKPVFAAWDDHDFGDNNGGKSYKNKSEAKSVFEVFFPVLKDSSISKGKGTSYNFKIGEHKFHFLDNRYYRDDNDMKDGSHFGEVQRQWLFKELSKEKLNWIVSGDQFFGSYHPWESFEGNHPEKFKTFLEDVKKADVPHLFISGDRHLFELMKVTKEESGRNTFELTSSGIHSKIYPGSHKSKPNKRRLGGVDDQHLFTVLETSFLNGEYVLNLSVKNKTNSTLFEKVLKIKK